MSKLNIYIKDNLDDLLKDDFIPKIKDDKASVFQTTYILSPNKGVENWLIEETARENTIFANFKFINIHQLIELVYHKLADEKTKRIISQNQLIWYVYNILENSGSESVSINEYFKKEPVSCALMVAELFDQYQNQDFKLLQKWENKESTLQDSEGSDDENWQSDLWRKILNEIRESEDKILFYDVIKYIKGHQKDLGSLNSVFSELHVFNDYSLSPIHIELLKDLGNYFPIHVYLKDIQFEKGELDSWRTLITKTLNSYNENSEVSPKSLKKDKISIHSNFTIRREIETWYNFFLKEIQEKEIDPRKVLVTVPDIRQYAPYIRAILDDAPVKLNYTIADEVTQEENNILELFSFLIHLDYDFINIEDIVHLTRFETVQKKYGITDTEFIQESLIAAKARRKFEFDDQEDEDYDFSIGHAIKRLVAGVFTNETEKEIAGVYPVVTTAEFNTSTELIGLAQMSEDLRRFLLNTRIDVTRTLQEWGQELEELITNFIDMDQDTGSLGLGIAYKIARVFKETEIDVKAVKFKDLRNYIVSQIELEEVKTNYLLTGITFSSMNPYRGVPFDMIAMLGMNQDFPRSEKRNMHDLIHYRNQENVATITDKDLHLMLEMVDNAKKSLFISYIGKNPSTLKDEFPSSVITTLLPEVYNKEKVVYHRLNVKDDEGDYYEGIKVESREEYKIPQPKKEPVYHNEFKWRIADVIKFFEDVPDFHFSKIKNLYPEEEEKLEGYETIDIGDLEKWAINNSILEQYINDSNTFENGKLEEFLTKEQAKGNLGLNVDSVKNEAREFYANLKDKLDDNLQMKKVDIPAFYYESVLIDEVAGYQNGDDKSTFYFVVASSNREKYQLRAMLYAIVLKQKWPELDTLIYITKRKDEPIEIDLSSDKFKAEFDELWSHFKENHLLLFPYLIQMLKIDITDHEDFKKQFEKDLKIADRDYSYLKHRSDKFKAFERTHLPLIKNENWRWESAINTNELIRNLISEFKPVK